MIKNELDRIFTRWQPTRSDLGPDEAIAATRAILAKGGDPVPTLERHLASAGSDYLMLRAYLAVLGETPPSARARRLFEAVVARLTLVDSTSTYLAQIARRHLGSPQRTAAPQVAATVQKGG